MEQFYKVVFECSNCKNKITKEITKGVRAIGNGGTCPNCMVLDEASNPFRIVSTFQQEILLE